MIELKIAREPVDEPFLWSDIGTFLVITKEMFDNWSREDMEKSIRYVIPEGDVVVLVDDLDSERPPGEGKRYTIKFPDPGHKTPAEIHQLKREWKEDPCWDLEDTDGFERYREELKEFRLKQESKWAKEREEKFRKKAFEEFSIVLSGNVKGGWVEDMAVLAETLLEALSDIEKLKEENLQLREDINRLYNRTEEVI